MFKKKLWLGLSSVFAVLLAVAITATTILFENGTAINGFLGTSFTKILNPGDEGYPDNGADATEVDTQYFKSQFGELNAENQAKLIEATWTQNVNEVKEGSVLLRNNTLTNGQKALPLATTSKVSLFGHAVAEPYTFGLSAGNLPEAGYDPDLYEAMTNVGYGVNETLYNALMASSTVRGDGGGQWAYGLAWGYEDSIDLYTTDVRNSWATDYNDAAIYVLAREAGEQEDMKLYDNLPSEGAAKWISADTRYETRDQRQSALALTEQEIAILEMLKAEKEKGTFKEFIVILNTACAMEVDWFDEYGVDAALFVGGVGSQGMRGVASILSGETNPSGHLVDTYAVDPSQAPALINSMENTPKYLNDTEISSTIGSNENGQYMTFQAEGIYIGYKYYETRYEDSILNQGNASNSNGASKGASSWKYETEVVYPFGYGLSYTTFEQTLNSVSYDATKDVYNVSVTVKNTGGVAGKSVVQVYAQTPYGQYERTNLVEKSAIQLAGFEKTKLLNPNETETVTVEVERYLLASYDYVNAKGYILSEGDYYLAVGDNAHDALNNVLKAKNSLVSGLVGVAGQTTNVSADAKKVYKFNQNRLDTTTYRTSSEGVVVTNKFDDCDLNYWVEGAGTYLSRNNWQSTWPVRTTVTATAAMMEVLKGEYYTKPEDAPSAAEIIANELGQNKGISFVTMKDVPYDDDLTWSEFINQMTLEEMLTVVDCKDGRLGVTSVNLPDTATGDGCDSLNGHYPFAYEDATGTWTARADKYTGKRGFSDSSSEFATTCYASKTVLTATFNKELYASRGDMYAEEALYAGKAESWCIGGNLHRSQYGGRNFEYMSEDANLNYMAAIPEVLAMQSRGMLAGIKHFSANDQENQRKGVSTFFNEQAFREGALRGFEGAIRVAGATTLMQSFNRIGMRFSSSCTALNIDVCENEWGFVGHKETDAISNATSGYLSHYATMLASGTDTFCYNSRTVGKDTLLAQVQATDDGNLVNEIRETAKNFFYAMSRSNAINGLRSDSIVVNVTPWWLATCYAAIAVVSVLLAAGVALYVVSFVKEERK